MLSNKDLNLHPISKNRIGLDKQDVSLEAAIFKRKRNNSIIESFRLIMYRDFNL